MVDPYADGAQFLNEHHIGSVVHYCEKSHLSWCEPRVVMAVRTQGNRATLARLAPSNQMSGPDVVDADHATSYGRDRFHFPDECPMVAT